MKKIILHNISLSLGSSVNYINTDGNKRWIYLLPSNSLISDVKAKIFSHDKQVLDSLKFMTFDQMMREIISYRHMKILTPSEQDVIVNKAIEMVNDESGLKYFANSIRKPGWVSKVEMWLGEMRRAGTLSESLIDMWEMRDNKYRELAGIYKSYQSLLKQYSLIDHEEPYFMFLARENNDMEFLKEYAGIITEQFYDFSPIQMQTFAKIGDSDADVEIHLAIDNTRKDLYNSVYRSIDYLTDLGFVKENVSDDNSNNNEGSLTISHHLRKSLFLPFTEKIDANGDFVIMITSGRKQEIEEICAEIKALIIDDGMSVEDIAIIVPQLNKYQGLIEKQMDKAKIPVKIPQKEPLIKNPLIQTIISFIRATKGQKDAWINLLSSPYFKWIEKIDSTTLVKLFRELSYPMSEDDWVERLKNYPNNEDNKDYYKCDKVMRQIYKLMNSLPQSATMVDFIAFLNKLESDLEVKNNIKEYFISNIDDRLAYRDFKAYEKWQELKREIISIEKYLSEGNERNYWNWLNYLIIGAEKSEYNFKQGKKTGVNLLQPNQIRGREFQAVFILGLIEGEFPRPIKNDWLLPDSERYLLRKEGLLFNFSKDYIDSQKYQFFQSVISAKEKLYFVYSNKSEAGGDNLHSFYIDETTALFEDNSIIYKTRELSDKVADSWTRCASEQQFLNKIYYDLHNYEHLEEGFKQAISNYDYYQKRTPITINTINNGLESEYERKNLVRSRFDGIISNDKNKERVLKRISTNIWSTTQLNLARNCRFAYFSRYILNLSDWREQEESLSPPEKGDILHRVLERFFEKFYHETENIFAVGLAREYIKEIELIADEEWHAFQNNKERIIDNILGNIDWERLKQNIYQIISHEIWWRKSSTSYFYPKFLEYDFGIAELRLIDKKIRLKGRIDRVDINDDGQFVVYDYKSGNLPSKADVMRGKNLQLPIYLLVLEAVCKYDLEQAIGTAFYGKGKYDKGEFKDNRNVGVWKGSSADKVSISDRLSSSIDDEKWYEWLNEIRLLIENLIEDLENGDFAVLPTDDCPKYCPYKMICRKDDQLIKAKKILRG